MPEGWALKTQSCTRYLFNLAMARFYKSLAQSYIFKVHYECLGLLEVPFTKLSNYLSSFSKDEILIVMEATGIYHLTLLSFLLEQELNVAVVNPLFIHAFTKSMTIRKTKTDAKDAHIISLFAKRNYATIRLSSATDIETIKPIVREKDRVPLEGRNLPIRYLLLKQI